MLKGYEVRNGFACFEKTHLQDPLIVNLVEDGAVDLVWFERYPVEDGHPELCLDWLLDFNSYVGDRGVSAFWTPAIGIHTYTYQDTRAGEWMDGWMSGIGGTHVCKHSVLLAIDHFLTMFFL